MKWNLKNFFVGFFLILGIITTYIIIKKYGLRNVVGFYTHFNGWLLLAYFATVFIIFIILTWRWNVILLSRGHKIEFKKLFIYRLIGQSINFFTPGPRVGGEPTQAALLKKHNVEFTEGLSTIMIDKIIDSTTCGVLFIIGALLVSMHYAIPKNEAIYMIIGGGLFLAIIISFYYRMLHDKHFFLNLFKILQLNKIKSKTLKKIEIRIEEIELIMIQFYKHNKKTFLLGITITLLSWVAMFIEYKLATTLLGLNLGFLELFFIITFIGMAMLFPVPMAVGALEAGQISAFNMIGLAGGAGVALAFLVRMKDFVFGVAGIILLAVFGFDIKTTIEKKYISKNN